MIDSVPTEQLEFEVSDPSEVAALQKWLSRLPDTRAERRSRPPAEGHLGAADVVVAVAGSSGVVALARMLPDFLRARRASIEVKVRHKGRELEIAATNIDHASTLIRDLLDT